MIKIIRRVALKTIVVAMALTGAAQAGDWTEPVEIRHEFKPCVSYRARLNGEFLVIEATHGGGWYTYAMDNKRRAEEKLAGRPSLGIDSPTEITLTGGLEAVGPWHQTPPKDASKPELLWFSWVFEEQAQFVAKVRRSGAGPVRVAIKGQACDGTTCKRVDLAISLPLTGGKAEGSAADLKGLVEVR